MRGSKPKAGNASTTVNSMLLILHVSDEAGRIVVYERLERDYGSGFARLVRAEFEKSLRAKG